MTNQNPVIKLKVSQILSVQFDRFQNFLSTSVTPAEALAQMLKAFNSEIAMQRENTKEAYAEMAKYLNPETGQGSLTDLRTRLARYSEEGERDAAELKEIMTRIEAGTTQRGDKTRQSALLEELNKDAANVRAVQSQLASAEGVHAQWQARFEERNAKLKSMREEYAALEAEGPMWLAQLADAKKAEEAADRDAGRNNSNTIADAQNLRAELQSAAQMAALREQAGRLIDEKPVTLDEEIAARERAQANDDLIAQWMGK